MAERRIEQVDDLGPGSTVTGEDGRKFTLGALVAIQGKEGCQDLRCSRLGDECMGYHCAICGEPSSMTGHKACQEAASAS